MFITITIIINHQKIYKKRVGRFFKLKKLTKTIVLQA